MCVFVPSWVGDVEVVFLAVKLIFSMCSWAGPARLETLLL